MTVPQHSHSVGHLVFQHRKGFRVRVSTIAFTEPQSFGILAAPDACYEGETCIFVETEGTGGREWRVSERICHYSRETAIARHDRIARRAMKHCRVLPSV